MYSHIATAEEIRPAHQELVKLVIQDCLWNLSQRDGTRNQSQRRMRGRMEESDKREEFLLVMASPGDTLRRRVLYLRTTLQA
jgi:hypothetical protein